jgi:AbrB family looped-hinge helix DNA binding protein
MESRKAIHERADADVGRNRASGNTKWYYHCHHGLMRVTSKGQVTIPRDVRRRLGIEPGSEVDFEVDGDAARLVRRTGCGGVAIVARRRGRRLTMSTDEIMALTRDDDS